MTWVWLLHEYIWEADNNYQTFELRYKDQLWKSISFIYLSNQNNRCIQLFVLTATWYRWFKKQCYNEHCRTDNIRQINKKLTACFLFLHMSRSSFNKTLMYTKDVKLTRNVLDRQYVCLNMFTFLTWHSIRGENIIIFYSR